MSAICWTCAERNTAAARTVRRLHGSRERSRQASCQTTLKEAAGKSVTTIEGLSAKANHPLQVAWKEMGVRNAATAKADRLCKPRNC